MRIGFGYDSHRLVPGRKLILGGIEIPFGKGLSGHSDADVLLHAICDAILGAIEAGDIGKHFPDTDDRYKGISSLVILRKVLALMKEKGYSLLCMDSTVIADEPILAPYINDMRETILKEVGPKSIPVSIKAKRNEGMESVIGHECMIAYVVCLIAADR